MKKTVQVGNITIGGGAPVSIQSMCNTKTADVKGSLELQLKYLSLVRALFSEVNPIPVKQAMNFMGMEVGPMRLPLTNMEPENAAVLLEELKKVGLVK
jgi:4-hydroxy-tetrahydrodipicolinate synthase